MRRTDHEIEHGSLPTDDGWSWLYRAFHRIAPEGYLFRRLVCSYFAPTALERWRNGLVYRLLGVQLFGSIIPTGGIAVRRIFKARMRPYTLAGTSLGAARAFYYRACVFETLHLPFLFVLLGLTLHRVAIGRPDLALENTVVNLLVNVYPIMHHRRTRMRITDLFGRR